MLAAFSARLLNITPAAEPWGGDGYELLEPGSALTASNSTLNLGPRWNPRMAQC